MKRSLLLLSLAALGASASAQTYVHSFEESYKSEEWGSIGYDFETDEDIEGWVTTYNFLPSTAGGFSYSGYQSSDIHTEQWQGAEKNTTSLPSGNWALKTESSTPLIISRATPFNFEKGFFSPFTHANELRPWSSIGLNISGYLGGVLQGSYDFDLTAGQFLNLSAPFAGIDELRITGVGNSSGWPLGEMAIDDLTFSEIETQAVPEPASMAALGLTGLALLRRRRKSA